MPDDTKLSENSSITSAKYDLSDGLVGYGQVEVERLLHQFSEQLITKLVDADKLTSELCFGSKNDVDRVISLFGTNGDIGKTLEYQGVIGYDPKHIQQNALKYSIQKNDLPSEFLGVRDMREYGSGSELGWEMANSARDISAWCQQYSQSPSTTTQLRRFREMRLLPLYSDLGFCRAARSILCCGQLSNGFVRGGLNFLKDWLLKIAVHAACTLERMESGEVTVSMAVLILFQLSREIGMLNGVLSRIGLSDKGYATIISLLIDAGYGFISAALCLLFSEQLKQKYEEEYCRQMIALSDIASSALSWTSMVSFQNAGWNELVKDCIRQTNYCPSQASVYVELHLNVMFHLVARCGYIATTTKLHEKCVDLCKHVESIPNYQQSGHLVQGCPCETTKFDPIETSDLVLYDTINRQLVQENTSPSYVAVSHVWFQGLFGQEKRSCGKCSLKFLADTCQSIGVQYIWIDTLCMPTYEPLRVEVVKKLRSIYLDADATLVVDIGLMSTAAETVLDLSLAISLSDWSSRIWTLQEGVLSSKLLFCVRDQVLSLPKLYIADRLRDPRGRVPNILLGKYGVKVAISYPFNEVLQLAVGRQTSWEQDYLYGLSALFPRIPDRYEDLNLVAKEVAGMYSEVDLGILHTPFPRCNIQNYRWMPKRAAQKGGGYRCGIFGSISSNGLSCDVSIFVKLASIIEEDAVIDANTHLEQRIMDELYSVKYWYSTEAEGVLIGTDVKDDQLIFCAVSHTDGKSMLGFVVSQGESGNFEYKGCAKLVGKVPKNCMTILVT